MSKKKNKSTEPERREQRLRKARQWVLTYEGKHIVRAYRTRFRLDYSCALRDLEAINALSPEKVAAMKAAEDIRLQKKQEERERKRNQELLDRFPN